jgi:hypothetical protein
MKLLLFLFTSVCFSFCNDKRQLPDCSKFRTGKFHFISKPDGVRIEVVRFDSVQTQYNPVTDTITGYQLAWTSACEYEVFKTYRTKKNITDPAQMRAIIELNNVVTFKFKIVEAHNDYYVFESSPKGSSFIYKDTVWVSK